LATCQASSSTASEPSGSPEQSLLSRVALFQAAFWKFLRPHTIRGTILGSMAVTARAILEAPSWVGLPLLQPFLQLHALVLQFNCLSLPACLPACLSVCRSMLLCVCLPVSLSACLFVCCNGWSVQEYGARLVRWPETLC
jgi:hypothetical protein